MSTVTTKTETHLLRQDLLRLVTTPAAGSAEAEVVLDASGGLRWWVAPAAGSVTLARMASLATDRIIGRATAGTGVPEALTCTAAGRAILDDADAAAQRTTLGLGTAAVAASTSFSPAVSGEFYLREDFVTNDLGGWTHSSAGGGFTYATPTLVAGHPGVIRIDSGASSGGSSSARPSSSMCFLANFTEWEAIVAPRFLAASGTVLRLGISNLTTGTAEPASGVFFEYLQGTSANWRLRSGAASTYTTVTSSTAVVFNSYLKFRITFNGTTVTFLLNGVSLGTITTNIPSVVMHPFFFVTQASASAFTSLDVDLVTMRQSGMSR